MFNRKVVLNTRGTFWSVYLTPEAYFCTISRLNAVTIAFCISIMQRLATKNLVAWKNDQTRKPLIVRGVRQCGKTYLLKEFGQNYYKDTAYFNFENNKALQARFDQDLDVNRLITELGLVNGKPLEPESTLIIFDEIQFCPNSLTSLKYFAENLPKYHIVCAGSLLGVALSKASSFPVGKVDFLTLYPMNFAEFLLANNQEMLYDYLLKLDQPEKVSELVVEKVKNLLHIFYFTGGMPEVVAGWVNNQDGQHVVKVQQQILQSYELDFAKYASVNDYPKMSLIWRSIPNQLAKESGKFIFSHAKKGLRAKDLEDALEWLINAGLVYKVAKIEKPGIPLSAYADQTYFKLYLSDVGLLGNMAGVPASAWLDTTNTAFKEFKGAVTENYVLTELVNLQNTAPYYWKSQNTAEVDFVTQFGEQIVPIEVKSAKMNRTKSLALYRKKYSPKFSVKTSLGDLGGGAVKNVPLYLVWNIQKLLFS